MSELIEITKEEYRSGLVKLWGKARRFASKTYGNESDPAYYYSKNEVAYVFFCGLSTQGKRNYRAIPKKGISDLTHFIDIECDKAKLNTVALCYAKINNNIETKYYYCEHKVGQCPHKTKETP